MALPHAPSHIYLRELGLWCSYFQQKSDGSSHGGGHSEETSKIQIYRRTKQREGGVKKLENYEQSLIAESLICYIVDFLLQIPPVQLKQDHRPQKNLFRVIGPTQGISKGSNVQFLLTKILDIYVWCEGLFCSRGRRCIFDLDRGICCHSYKKKM